METSTNKSTYNHPPVIATAAPYGSFKKGFMGSRKQGGYGMGDSRLTWRNWALYNAPVIRHWNLEEPRLGTLRLLGRRRDRYRVSSIAQSRGGDVSPEIWYIWRRGAAVINAELTLAKWNGQTTITAHRDCMKVLRTRLACAGLSITDLQFYNHIVNSLPAGYDMVVAIHGPAPSNYSIDTLCERFRAIELRKELRASKDNNSTDDSIALMERHKRFPRPAKSIETGPKGVSERQTRSRGSHRFTLTGIIH